MGGARLRAAVVVAALVAAACGPAADRPAERAEPSSSLDSAETSTLPSTSAEADVPSSEPPTTAGPPATSSTTPTPSAPVSSTPAPTTAPAAPVEADACPTIPPRRAPDPNRPVYVVSMSADPMSGAVRGSSTVTFIPDLPVDTLVLRLWANGPRPASAGTSIDIGEVVERSADGVVRPVERPDPTTAVVRLGSYREPGETIVVTVPWSLDVGGTVNDRISRQAGSLRLGSFLPLLAWEPGVGWSREPPTSGFAESTSSPTADWTIDLDVPDGFEAIVSGEEVGEGRWEARRARDVAVAVGRFSHRRAEAMAPHPVEVVVSVHDGVDDPERYLARVVASLERFAAAYGPYPWDVYRLSITPDLSGGIEFPMHVLQGPGTDGRTTPHEVAHMWFYGLVGNVQGRDPFLDEGLATFAEGRFEATLRSMQARSIPTDGRGRAGEPMTYWESRSGSYYRSVYVQTAAALANITTEVDLVDCALAHYVAANAHAIARPEDLFASLDATFVDWRPALAAAGLGS